MLQPYASPVERAWYFGMRGLVGLILAFLFLPILVIVPLSFNADSFLMYPMSGFSLRWYEEFATSPAWRQALMNSLIVSPLATLLAMVLGTLASIGLVRAEFPGKALLTAVLISPMVVPVVVIGVAMYIFFAPLGLTGSYTGLVLAHAILGVPFVVTTVTATLQGFDFNLVRAASSLGAKLDYAVCMPDKCVAEVPLSDAVLASLKKGSEVVFTSVNFQRAPNPIKLSLEGFTGVYDGEPIEQSKLEERQRLLQEEMQKKAEEARKKLEEAQKAAKSQ